LFFKQFDMYIHLSFQIYGHYGGRGEQMVNAQKYVFYFESDTAKVFPFRPSCSSYDSERKKSQKWAKKDLKRKWTNVANLE
jgi:hypothetical protein